ncbi:DUF4112 domain-containing protein [Aspergillus ruber CBS 135680]|uniref:PH domain protein n=1 Tax=Aspergillus ruber (strain CBS 135680) TaxID=1388766 RepID=A0A017SD16_ASPRC|nr:uncharacterized protein EURHEDRAFT_413705 [Aspergillus ruber CBS 135680]EYE94095.1 hypothetical protein EURHEDRAFT_413705 [Aspergillus ruber CBS 135680]
MSLWGILGKRVLAESARNHFGQEDPYFEEVPASRLNRAIGKKTQKRRKAAPPGLSDNDAKVLTQVKRRAYRLDYCLFNLCGIQFGWSSVIALIPFIGDIVDTLFALMVVKSCGNIDGGLPSSLHAKMISNVIIDFVIGLVPFVGDLADAMYKCNSRNAIILEKHLRQKGKKNGKNQRGQQDMSLPEEWDKYDNGTTGDYPNHGDQEYGTVETPAKPQRARHPQRSRSQGRWFGGSKNREGDIEHGAA